MNDTTEESLLSRRQPAFSDEEPQEDSDLAEEASLPGKYDRDPEHFLQKLEAFRLPERSIRELNKLFNIQKHNEEGSIPRPVRCNLLIECEEDEAGLEAAQAIAAGLKDAGFLTLAPAVTKEGTAPVEPAATPGAQLLRPQPRPWQAFSLPGRRALIIHNCRELPVQDPVVSTMTGEELRRLIRETETKETNARPTSLPGVAPEDVTGERPQS